MRVVQSLAVLLVVASSASAVTPSFQGLGDLPGGAYSSGAAAVSADGSVVVGESTSGSRATDEVFRWTQQSGMVGLGDLPGSNLNLNNRGSKPQGISADGSVIVGDGSAADSVPVEAFRWTQQDGMVGLGYLSAEKYSEAFGVSGDGTIVVGTGRSYEAFRWTQQSGMQPLSTSLVGVTGSGARGISSDGSTIIGGISNIAGDQAMRWTEATGMVGMGFLPNAPPLLSLAGAASKDGSVIVGFSSSANATTGNYEAFRWTQQTGMVGLGDLPGGTFNSTADGISADGSIIVGTSTTGLGDEAFIWDSGNGMRNLRDVLVNDYGLGAALTGWQLIGAVISADGHTFAGSGINPDGNTEAWVATVPEPSSLTLAVVMGAFAVFCCFRNRKSRLSRVD